MNTQRFASLALGLLLAGTSLASLAQATIGFTATEVALRAGPAPDYPVVAVLAPGVQVAVQGCVPDYSWCDVAVGSSRGWMDAGYLSYPYQGTPVPVLQYGPLIGIGVLGFALNDYWDHHYRGRSWYRDRDRWAQHQPHFRPGPARPFHAPGRMDPPQRPRHQEAFPIGPRSPQALPSVVPDETRGQRGPRGQRDGDWRDRGERGDRGDRGDRIDRDRGDRGERGDRDRSDRGDRGDRGGRGDGRR